MHKHLLKLLFFASAMSRCWSCSISTSHMKHGQARTSTEKHGQKKASSNAFRGSSRSCQAQEACLASRKELQRLLCSPRKSLIGKDINGCRVVRTVSNRQSVLFVAWLGTSRARPRTKRAMANAALRQRCGRPRPHAFFRKRQNTKGKNE